MAFRVRVNCYVCDRVYQPGQMARIDGNNNPDRQNIAIFRRLQLRRPPLEVADESRLCLNCNLSIRNEIEELQRDPGCLRLNVLTQTGRQTCMFCNADVNTPRLSIECRVNAFIVMDIFIPEETRACLNHLDEHGFILGPLLPGLQAINRPYRIPGQQLLLFLQQLRNEANVYAAAAFNNEDSFTDEEFEAIAPVTKEQFRELYAFCDPIPQLHGHGARYVRKKDLLTFLCKMRQGLSDEFLKVIFHYSSRQATSMAISTVRESLMQRFVPGNIGFNAISREEFIERHVTSFANELYNPQPEIPRAIAIIDGTYAYMQKSSNFRVLRQSFCKHKGRHLVKPALIVAPDGYILEIQGPYFSDSQNSDAQVLINEFERDVEGMREFFDIGDIFIEDRGYRDAQPLLKRLGIVSKIPPFLQQGQSQLVTEEANEARLITKSRWIVESRNGHIKSIFKFFEKTIPMAHVHNLRDFFRIAGAIINRYHPLIEMQGATAELAREYIARAREANIVQARVEVDNMRYGNANWNRLHELQVPQFPRLTLEEIRDITIGVYQVELAPSYVQDKLQREEDEEFQLDTRLNEPGLIRVRVFSRFRNATRYQLWIAFNEIDDIGPDNNETLLGYYCTCKSGARTLGTCAHIASVLWFLGYARHQQHVKYPQTSLLQRILDAANRGEQANPNQEPEIV